MFGSIINSNKLCESKWYIYFNINLDSFLQCRCHPSLLQRPLFHHLSSDDGTIHRYDVIRAATVSRNCTLAIYSEISSRWCRFPQVVSWLAATDTTRSWRFAAQYRWVRQLFITRCDCRASELCRWLRFSVCALSDRLLVYTCIAAATWIDAVMYGTLCRGRTRPSAIGWPTARFRRGDCNVSKMHGLLLNYVLSVCQLK